MKRTNLMLLLLAFLVTLSPLLSPLPKALEQPFAGADAQAEALIVAANPDYQRWFEPLWEPPSGEIETLLFALQAALGSGLLGYYLGLRRGQSQRREHDGANARD